MKGNNKPYDAEVEYLESADDGLRPIIIIDYIPNGLDLEFFIDFKVSGSNSTGYVFNTYHSKTAIAIYRIMVNSATTKLYFNYASIDSEQSIIESSDTKQRFKVIMRNDKIVVNGVPYPNTASSTSVENINELTFFDRKDGLRHTYMKLYSFKLDKGGVPQLDLIPVRVGSVGYMYDRVSGKLFGNSGTGRFILGPDIV